MGYWRKRWIRLTRRPARTKVHDSVVLASRCLLMKRTSILRVQRGGINRCLNMWGRVMNIYMRNGRCGRRQLGGWWMGRVYPSSFLPNFFSIISCRCLVRMNQWQTLLPEIWYSCSCPSYWQTWKTGYVRRNQQTDSNGLGVRRSVY